MSIDVVSFFKPQTKGKGRPLLNQVPISSTDKASVGISSVIAQKMKFWKWFRQRPELNSPVMIRVDDTITDVDFLKSDGSPLGRNKRLEAEKFWADNQLSERLKSIQFDRLVTGSGFLWIGNALNQRKEFKEAYLKQVKEICEVLSNTIHLKTIDSKKVATSLFLRAIDEDLRLPRKVDYIPSSTVMIEHDRHDIKKYVQTFNAYTEDFNPRDVIHIPLTRVDGKVDGFTPVESLTHELILLWAIKENMLAWFRNGGTPNKIFVLPDEIANSENHRWLTQQLMERGVVENRHGNLVLTGEIKIEDLEMNPKDMEYKDLSLYVTGLIAYALRVPVSRIPFMIGKAQSGSDAGGMAESGYWSMIESDQKTLEMHLNSQLFEKMGFSIRFRKRYKLDDIREAQALNYKVDAVTKTVMELKNNKMKLTRQKLLSMLDIAQNEVEDLTDEELMSQFQKTGLLNKTFASDSQVMQSEEQQGKANTKRGGAINNPKDSLQSGF